uniref:DIS3-like exonuclease 2 n=1 Tax=Dermatophagoides pteronyssinus TaxID=6956 RepID=A0A6P6XP24_DERPT|nr:DIS3-like exonuclease 2 [Dermatophagoides pteronyssinus]
MTKTMHFADCSPDQLGLEDIETVKIDYDLGKLFRGEFFINSLYPTDGFLRMNNIYWIKDDYKATGKRIFYSCDIAIKGYTDMHSALHGDEVLVRLKSRKNWLPCSEQNEKCECKVSEYCPTRQPVGVIVYIIKRITKPIIASIVSTNNKIAIITPTHNVYPVASLDERFELPTSAVEGKLYKIEYTTFFKEKFKAKVSEELGLITDLKTIENSLLSEFELTDTIIPFSNEALQYTKNRIKDVKTEIETNKLGGNRKILNNKIIMSIDPVTARDRDDAVHVTVLKKKNKILSFSQVQETVIDWIKDYYRDDKLSVESLLDRFGDDYSFEVGVHIADVSYMVLPNSPLEEYVRKRPTTIYFPHKTIHMLPSILSEDLLSLDEKGDKIAVSFVMTLQANMEVKSVKYFRSLIKVQHALTYYEVEDIFTLLLNNRKNCSVSSNKNLTTSRKSTLDDKKAKRLLSSNLNINLLLLLALSERLYRLRKPNDIGICNTLSINFLCSKDDSKQIEVELYSQLRSMKLVQELMLLANKCVATELVNKFGLTAVLRSQNHVIDLDRYKKKLSSFTANNFALETQLQNITFDKMAQFHAFLLEKLNPEVYAYFSNTLKQLQNPAIYALYNKLKDDPTILHDEYSHTSLGFHRYTHFTSPIRRYPDILVHRQLLSINNDSKEWNKRETCRTR